MKDGISRTGRFHYFWKGDEYFISDSESGREFHLGLVMNYQVAYEIVVNTCAVLEALVAYDSQNKEAHERLLSEMQTIYLALTCPCICDGCNMQGHDQPPVFYLACYLKSRIKMLGGG